MLRYIASAGLAVAALTFAACGDDNGDGTGSAACESPDSLSLKVAKLEAEQASCATAGAVAVAASECYFDSGVSECPELDVGGTRWDCSFQITGPPGSGGLSAAVCLAQGGPEVRFETQLTGD